MFVLLRFSRNIFKEKAKGYTKLVNSYFLLFLGNKKFSSSCFVYFSFQVQNSIFESSLTNTSKWIGKIQHFLHSGIVIMICSKK